jgi:hypothetical protein
VGQPAGSAFARASMTTIRSARLLTACSAASPGDQRSADQVVADLAAEVSTAQADAVFTAGTDPNKLLGRPNGCSSKASFVDTRIDPTLAGNQPGTVEAGGSVEVFQDDDAALARQNYIITELAKQGPDPRHRVLLRRRPRPVARLEAADPRPGRGV